MSYPADLKYTREHEWVRNNGDGTVTVGITNFAQSELGDIVFVELNPVGTVVSKDQPFGTVEAVKTVSELFAPISGEILELNAALDQTPEVVNEDPYQTGWMVKMSVSNPAELEELLSSDAYQEVIS
jgi:glycine cleavage system H protein